MLAVCSDLDETPDAACYLEIARFLNTTDATSMGPGIGLEIGNSIYFDMPPDQFAYWNTSDAGRAMIQALIRSGHIDCLHSYGDLATTRAHAERALAELSRHHCTTEVWVDHATAPTNFGADIMHGQGDMPGSVCYHADLTRAFGVRFIWCGRVTSVIGQEQPPSWRGIFRAGHPVASSRTVAKEISKHLLARAGDEKYAMHGPNRLMRETRLRDGGHAYEFIRCNPYWGCVDGSDTAAGIANVLTRPFLERLVARSGVGILYTHLGKVLDPRRPFPEASVRAWRVLADFAQQQRILVTTTRRLLGYHLAMQHVQINIRQGKTRGSADTENPVSIGTSGMKDAPCAGTQIEITAPAEIPPQDLDGITVYVDDPQHATMSVNGRVIEPQRNPADDTGRSSVSIPWRNLSFPDVRL